MSQTGSSLQSEPDRQRIQGVLEILAKTYPVAECALHHTSPFQLLAATILSAQCTDSRVNQVTPRADR